jgi:hypothetical protein
LPRFETACYKQATLLQNIAIEAASREIIGNKFLLFGKFFSFPEAFAIASDLLVLPVPSTKEIAHSS